MVNYRNRIRIVKKFDQYKKKVEQWKNKLFKRSDKLHKWILNDIHTAFTYEDCGYYYISMKNESLDYLSIEKLLIDYNRLSEVSLSEVSLSDDELNELFNYIADYLVGKLLKYGNDVIPIVNRTGENPRFEVYYVGK